MHFQGVAGTTWFADGLQPCFPGWGSVKGTVEEEIHCNGERMKRARVLHYYLSPWIMDRETSWNFGQLPSLLLGNLRVPARARTHSDGSFDVAFKAVWFCINGVSYVNLQSSSKSHRRNCGESSELQGRDESSVRSENFSSTVIRWLRGDFKLAILLDM